MPTDIPPVGAPSPSAYIMPKHHQHERRQPPPKKHEPEREQETEHHDGIDCYT